MKKIYTFALCSALALSAFAQDDFDAVRMTESDLNGTARYVGMGGALGALGGDISVMSSNPAGTGLFRRSEFSVTGGALISNDYALGCDKTRASLDNFGGVFSIKLDDSGQGLQYFNIGLNYKKNRNYLGNLNTGIDGIKGKFSQTFQIAKLANIAYADDNWGMLPDLAAESTISGMEHQGILMMSDTDNDGKYDTYDGVEAKSGSYSRATYGHNSEFDVNLGFNVSDQYFFGITMGIYNMDYSRESFYTETSNEKVPYTYSLNNWYRTTGEGVDVKFGLICRPIEDSSFRFGLSVSTPIWYSLTDANGATITYDNNDRFSLPNGETEYRFRTPWKIDASLGYTIGNNIALGAEYEFADISSCHYSSSNFDYNEYFRDVNNSIHQNFKGQHTLKLGAEIKPVKNFSLRVGYNYVSSPFTGKLMGYVYDGSPKTETDWTNWKAINRFTAGAGFRFANCYFDIAYQYQKQNGDFYAFCDGDDSKGGIGFLPATKISNDRQQIIGTFGVRF